MLRRGDLASHIAQAGYGEEQIVIWLAQEALAVAHLHHDLHMVHRDIKSQNMFIDANNDLRLGDLGFSEIFADGMRAPASRCFTPGCCSPELSDALSAINAGHAAPRPRPGEVRYLDNGYPLP